MPVRHKPGSKPYRDQLRASLSAMGAQGPRLIELVARDLLLHGTRPRQAWRYAAELSQREAAGRFNQLTGNPLAPMTGNRIGDYEQWPDGGVPAHRYHAEDPRRCLRHDVGPARRCA